MLKLISKTEKYRRQLTNKEINQELYQVFRSFFGHAVNKYLIRYLLHLQPKSSPFTKIRNICILTGRSRSVYRSFRLSRLKLREYAIAGYFVGLTKASW